METKLDMRRARELTRFGTLMMTKALAMSRLTYSNEIAPLVKRKLLVCFFGKIRKRKLKVKICIRI